MAAKTTIKVALTNNAAKDDYFSGLGWNETNFAEGGLDLNVLGNDPGSAKITGLFSDVPKSGANVFVTSLDVMASRNGVDFGLVNLKIAADGQVHVEDKPGGFSIESLAEGETLTVNFYYNAQMANGAYSVAKVTLEIAGENDGPVITSLTQAGIVQEDVLLTASGQVTSSDVDHNATATYSGNATGDYGSFKVNPSTGEWEYILNNDAHQSLAQGETHTEKFTVTVTDDHGATATQVVTITVTGTNDAPKITAETGALSDTSGDDTFAPIAGQLEGSDIDNGASLTYSLGATGQNGNDAYGTLTVDSDGKYSFVANDAAVEALKSDVTLTYNVVVEDEFHAKTPSTLTITLHGENDIAEITGDATGAVKEDATDQVVSGSLSVTDRDDADVFASVDPADLKTEFGKFTFDESTGDWTFTLDNEAAQSLYEGETKEAKLTVASTDGTVDKTITVTITGTNDAPEITAETGSLSDTSGDDTFAPITGQLDGSDVDNNAFLTYGLDVTGQNGNDAFGTLTVAADGKYSFVANDAAVEALKSDLTLTYNVVVEDEFHAKTPSTLTITLHGKNDIADITGDATGAVTEDAASNTVSGNLSVTDRDDADVFAAVNPADLHNDYGDFTFNPMTGDWTFTLNNSLQAVQDLNDGGTETVSLTVFSADGSASKTITVTIHGADEPVVNIVTPVPYSGDDDINDNNNDDLANKAPKSVADGNTGDNTIYGSAGDDKINGNSGDDKIYGGAGVDDLKGNSDSDTIYGGSGDDKSLAGGEGDDTIYGGSGNDKSITGGEGNDTIYGGSGSDTIDAGTGNDKITGGYGADTITGGNGDDTIYYISTLDTGDVILDFKNPGADKLDFQAIDANSATVVDDAFGSITQNAGVVANSLTYHQVTNADLTVDTVIWADTDGDINTVELQVTLKGYTGSLTGGSDVLL